MLLVASLVLSIASLFVPLDFETSAIWVLAVVLAAASALRVRDAGSVLSVVMRLVPLLVVALSVATCLDASSAHRSTGLEAARVLQAACRAHGACPATPRDFQIEPDGRPIPTLRTWRFGRTQTWHYHLSDDTRSFSLGSRENIDMSRSFEGGVERALSEVVFMDGERSERTVDP